MLIQASIQQDMCWKQGTLYDFFSGRSLGPLFNHEDVSSMFIRKVGEIRTIQEDITLKNQRFESVNSRDSSVQWNLTMIPEFQHW